MITEIINFVKLDQVMKSKIIISLLCLAVGLTLCARDAGSVIKQFKNETGAGYVGVPKFAMFLAGMVSDESAARGVKSVQVLDMGDCPSTVQDKFYKEVSDLAYDGYDEYVRVKENGRNVRILAKGNDEHVKDMVVLCQDSSECVMVRITGKIKLSEMMEVAEDQYRDM